MVRSQAALLVEEIRFRGFSAAEALAQRDFVLGLRAGAVFDVSVHGADSINIRQRERPLDGVNEPRRERQLGADLAGDGIEFSLGCGE